MSRRMIMMASKALPPFYPTEVSNLKFFLDIDKDITKDASNNVSNWKDQSVNGFNFANDTTRTAPVYQANVFGSKPALFFKQGRVSTTITLAERTIYLVVKQNGAPFVGGYNGFVGQNVSPYYMVAEGIEATNISTFTDATRNSGFVRSADAIILKAEFCNGYERITRNGVAGTQFTGRTFVNISNTFSVGRTADSADQDYHGWMGDVLAFTGAVSAADDTKIMDYLKSKFNIVY